MRTWVNYAIDVFLFLTALSLAISALLVWVFLPKGYNPGWLLWIAIHKWSGFALVIEVVLHSSLHVGWMVRMTKRLFRRS